MASYLSSVRSVLTNTTSRYDKLRKTLLSDESDGETEDDSHVSRILRAYYIEKGRHFPSWLPADPKSSHSSSSQYTQMPRQQSQQLSLPRRGAGLSDLWDAPSTQSPMQEPQSLRRSGASALRVPLSQSSRDASFDNAPSARPGGARPLPSQREGSYQNQGSSLQRLSQDADGPTTPFTGSGTPTPGASAQDRLKAKLWGTRNASALEQGGQGQRQVPGRSRGLGDGYF